MPDHKKNSKPAPLGIELVGVRRKFSRCAGLTLYSGLSFKQRRMIASGDIMKSLLPLTLITLLLCGCPDAKVPKVPPKVPEPKAAATTPHSLPDAPSHDRIFT